MCVMCCVVLCLCLPIVFLVLATAVMMMPPHFRATFLPNAPLKYLPPPITKTRKQSIPPMTGVFQILSNFETTTTPPPRNIQPTPQSIKIQARNVLQQQLLPFIEEYRNCQRDCGGEYHGMNCYNTLFVGRKLLRAMETFDPVKDIKLVTDPPTGKSRKYAFVEYDNKEDMKRAYRAADGMRLEGRSIVVAVERGHTVPTWLPRLLGGGLGGTWIGGKEKNVMIQGRYDPSRPDLSRLPPPMPTTAIPTMMNMDGPEGPLLLTQPPPGMEPGRDHVGSGGGGGGGTGGGYGGRPPESFVPWWWWWLWWWWLWWWWIWRFTTAE
jgi:U1 small nuclear ribonucleoprotein 70kDa